MPPLTLPSDLVITQDELDFDSLFAVLPGTKIYFAAGRAGTEDMATLFLDALVLQDAITNYEIFIPLGELAEKPGKVDSKSDKLKTRNYLIPGRRSSTVELTICGLSAKQKDYLESDLFQGAPLTLFLSDKEIESIDPELEDLNLVMFSGFSWTVDWSGEADGLWSVVISTELQGETEDLVYPVNVPVYVEPEE